MLINMLNEVINKINIYYKINEDIINNYDDNDKNRNYETLYYLNQYKNDNNKNIDELKKIIECNNIKEKFDNIFNIYTKMNIDEINLTYKVEDDEVKLFSKIFVENNMNNCKLLINGKEQELKDTYTFGLFKTKKDILEIKLKGITKITNMCGMFFNCSSLSSLGILDNVEQFRNIQFILVAFEVSHLDISGNEDNNEQSLNI